MNPSVLRALRDASQDSETGSRNFPQIVASLMNAGVERYHHDLQRSERTYYLPDGSSEVVANPPVPVVPAQSFSAIGVEAAVRAVQAGEIKYVEFCRRAMEAGCVAYIVSLAGKRVVYYGRSGDTHVEYFPGSR
jgi:uncharacterized protein YbcV (DUF1398 family)